MRTRALILLPVCMLLGCPASNHAPVQNRAPLDSSKQLQAAVEEYLKDQPNILGTIVKVDIQGTESFETAAGFIDSSRAALIEPDTNFLIGSVTKIFTAVLVLQLVERGQVRLQEPIMEYLPREWSAILEKIEHADEITVEHALSHRTGLADVSNSEAFQKSLYFDSTAAWKPMDILRMVQEKGDLEFRPGENYHYCNINYLLLGALIEHVSGLSYRQSLEDNILDRIGLENTSLVGETYGSFEGTIAHGYSRFEGVLYDGSAAPVEWVHAEGGIISTAGDLIAFYRALAAGDLFEDAGTYQRMCEPVGYNESYGLGLEISDDPDVGLYYGHRGSFMSTRSILAYFPAEQMTIAIAQTYDGFSMSGPADLMKWIVRRISGEMPVEASGPELEGPEILADTSNLIANADAPAHGEWDFAPREEWRLNSLGHHPLGVVGDIHVDNDGSLYLLDRGSAMILVLDSDGNLLRSFGGHGDGPRFEYPWQLFITPRFVQVLDMGREKDRIKNYDKSGSYVGTTDISKEISPRLFIDDNRYVAVRSGPDVLNRPTNELLEILSLTGQNGLVLTKFPAEDKLIMEVLVPMGRYILLENNINVFPRLIVHFDGEMLYLGRSDKYVLKKIDLSGGERLAFSLAGRKRETLPPDYAETVAGRTEVAGKEMTEETKERFLARFPKQQSFYTKVATDEQGLIYVFLSNIADFGTQEIDIFSPEGRYLYHAIIELPDGLERIRPLELEGEHLYALAKGKEGRTWLVKYNIHSPE